MPSLCIRYPYPFHGLWKTPRHDDDMLRLNQSVTIITKRRKNDAVVLRMFLVSKETTAHAVLQTVWLVIDLLQHKVIKTTLAQFADIQIHGLDIIMTCRMLQVDDVQFLSYTDVRNLTILQIHHFIRMLHDRRSITGDTLRTQPRHR